MPLNPSAVDAVVFDYGNTLIPYGPEQIERDRQALVDVLEAMFGPCDVDRLKEIRDRQIVAPYKQAYRENDLMAICRELVESLYELSPSDTQVHEVVDARHRTFVDVVELPDGVRATLEALRKIYRLALVSNYPSGPAIRESLDKIGITDLFDTIVVSGDVGFVKPHPLPFQTMLDTLALKAGRCVYVGDNWLADVQGGGRLGIATVLTTQYVPYERFEPQEGDLQPDAVIERLDELCDLFLHP